MSQSSSPNTRPKRNGESKMLINGETFKPLMGDSLEVMGVYFKERISAFSDMLQYLNVLENAPEIEFLCREITVARKALNKIHLKKNFTA